MAPSRYRELPVEDGNLPLRAVVVSEQDRGAYPSVESLDERRLAGVRHGIRGPGQ
ncbi:MAG: hypothetical protein U5L11_08480 [Arhodomonas sp.]|nr:hypothetical protein [Arhodomonas sp.]